MNKFILVFGFSLALLWSQNSMAQQDSIAKPKQTFLNQSIVPLSLIGAGLFVNYSKGSLGKVALQNRIQNGLNFHTKAENYIQFAPLAVLASADAFGLNTANTLQVHAKNAVLVTFANYVLVQSIKSITNTRRPNGGHHSFPSGHTSNAFALADMVHHELKDFHPVLAYSGYLFATTTGVFRILNNKHWVSDVLVGAGVGMLVTDVFYRIQSKNKTFKKQKKITSIFVPSFKEKTFGISGILYF